MQLFNADATIFLKHKKIVLKSSILYSPVRNFQYIVPTGPKPAQISSSVPWKRLLAGLVYKLRMNLIDNNLVIGTRIWSSLKMAQSCMCFSKNFFRHFLSLVSCDTDPKLTQIRTSSRWMRRIIWWRSWV